MKKKILVTGGFGFIGATLVRRLLESESNALVHIVDNLSTSSIEIDDYLTQIGNPSNLSYDLITVDQFFNQSDVGYWDEIYHLASPVGPAGVLKHAGKMIQEVVRDVYLIIDYCLENKSRFVDVSTSEIYGGGQGGYCPESTNRIVPAKTTIRLEYAIAKLAAETAIINTCAVTDLEAVIIRPFNVAGPRQSPVGGFVLPRFIQQAMNETPLTVFGDGSAIRAFTHVEDMANGIILGMKKGGRGEAYNVGNPENRVDILTLAKKVIEVTGSTSEIAHVDPTTIYGAHYAEASDKYPDAEKAKNELGWAPRYDITATIRDAQGEISRQLAAGVLKGII